MLAGEAMGPAHAQRCVSIADMVDAMAEAGAPAAAIAIAVRALEAMVAETEARRSAAREKKHRQRAEARGGDGMVPGQARNRPDRVPGRPPKTKVSPTPPSKAQTSSTPSPPIGGSVPTPSGRRSRRCPADYQPGPKVLDSDAAAGFSPGEIERELARFKDHQFRDARSDWDAAFRNWLRRATDQLRPMTSHVPARSGGSAAHIDKLQRVGSAMRAAAVELRRPCTGR
jgi:hypothetical protein